MAILLFTLTRRFNPHFHDLQAQLRCHCNIYRSFREESNELAIIRYLNRFAVDNIYRDLAVRQLTLYTTV